MWPGQYCDFNHMVMITIYLYCDYKCKTYNRSWQHRKINRHFTFEVVGFYLVRAADSVISGVIELQFATAGY